MEYIKTYELFGGLKKFFKKNIEPIIEPLKPKVYNNIDDILNDKSLSHSGRVEKIDIICRKLGIYRYILNYDYSIDCSGSINLNDKGLTEIPLKFRKVFSFDIKNNKLKSLKNCPTELRYLDASNNQIESLEYCPKIITSSLKLKNNKIKSVEGLTDCEHINLEGNEISDISSLISLKTNTHLNLSHNNITELYTLNRTKSVYIMNTPIYSVLLRLYNGIDYPDSNWVDGFNSYNIIYNDGIGKPKLFTDNLLNFKSMRPHILRNFIDRIEEDDAYEITTMEEYFNKQKGDE